MGVSNFVSIVCLLFSDVITDRDTTHDKMKIVEHSGKTLPCLARLRLRLARLHERDGQLDDTGLILDFSF